MPIEILYVSFRLVRNLSFDSEQVGRIPDERE